MTALNAPRQPMGRRLIHSLTAFAIGMSFGIPVSPAQYQYYLCPDGLRPSFMPGGPLDACLPATPEPTLIIKQPQSHIRFDRGSAELTPAAKARLDQLTAALRQHPEIFIEAWGHTDPLEAATDQARLALGLARARAVMDDLIAGGVPPDHIEARTRGSRAELVSENAEESVLASLRHVSIEPRATRSAPGE